MRQCLNNFVTTHQNKRRPSDFFLSLFFLFLYGYIYLVKITFAIHNVWNESANGESEGQSDEAKTKAKEKQGGKDSPLLPPHHPVGVAT